MKTISKKDGFTLVELLVGIVVSAVVFTAATAFLLTGMKMGGLGNSTSTRQNAIRVMHSLLLNNHVEMIKYTLASVADNTTIPSEDFDPGSVNNWTEDQTLLSQNKDDDGNVTTYCHTLTLIADKDTTPATILLSFDCETGAIYTGSVQEGNALLDGITDFEFILNYFVKTQNWLLTLEFQVDDIPYKMSISYPRPGSAALDASEQAPLLATGDELLSAEAPPQASQQLTVAPVDASGLQEKALTALAAENLASSEYEAKCAFINLLFSQMGSTGEILNYNEGVTYYSEWYIEGYDRTLWTSETPWCACYINWALDKVSSSLERTPRFADPQKGAEWFQMGWVKDGVVSPSPWKAPDKHSPKTGDLVFFDWNQDGAAQHVGVVLFVEDGRVYTIEGNVNDRVETLSYALTDVHISGYGPLKWITQ